ncbi:hypothetical protein FISHEDRAFT_54211 [Fistulina hepatica ATCC 64428]|uniref:Uncharacterized protein n=1 Tax=Fistulina hepatica ATCC 64428 TaxID=1128425 RepID=A0A0D6ZZW7_9AGAR|nr:hypothetical protein FISHEDRAFT_54211 [Fistulina hepatica ATCC 64428]
MKVLGVANVPSEHLMDIVDKELQQLCTVSTVRYAEKLGNLFHMNDFSHIVAQEMANPQVRPHLHFLPEDAGKKLGQAYQAKRWLHELDANLATPMIRSGVQDYYVNEPALLLDRRGCAVVLPRRWFLRDNRVYGSVALMQPAQDGSGWSVIDHSRFDVPVSDFSLSFPRFVSLHERYGIMDPCKITDIETAPGTHEAWTNPSGDSVSGTTVGNRLRKLARGQMVLPFPIWLYCDDTSGNSSKKWNKHNSLLFTPAGLPRQQLHKQSSIHFLSTSNQAPLLEMLDAFVEQLQYVVDLHYLVSSLFLMIKCEQGSTKRWNMGLGCRAEGHGSCHSIGSCHTWR